MYVGYGLNQASEKDGASLRLTARFWDELVTLVWCLITDFVCR